MQYLKKETLELDVTIINDCESCIFFGDTMSKGKKNDCAFHNACLTHLIDFLDKERVVGGKSKIKITWYIRIDVADNMYA